MPTSAETLRLATFHTDLARDGPGLLLRDILRGEDEQISAVLQVITEVAPDILLLQDIDYDAGGQTLSALAGELADAGLAYPYRLALRPNRGRPTGLDLNGDGYLGDAADAHGFGFYNGHGGTALLSRHPFGEGILDHAEFLWRDLPGSQAPQVLRADALEVLRLNSVSAWEVPMQIGSTRFTLLATHASAPVFDGPEDRNGRRNEDQLRFWRLRLEGWAPEGLPDLQENPVVMGVFNADRERGEARREGLVSLLDHPALQDPEPFSEAGADATVDWPDPGPGRMRVSYILPSRDLVVSGSGVHWSDASGDASRHRLVWVDLEITP